ncbi:MAG TPA: altronate dehydratase family protein [Anaerolineae bacterium]|nr:altronate dehydratase family protein [Anaerolineae bacterium]
MDPVASHPEAWESNSRPLSAVALRLHPADDVAIARHDLPAGLVLTQEVGAPITLPRPVPAGHKMALVPVVAGRPLRRYGHAIGLARCDIAPGEHVHTHNLTAGALENLLERDPTISPVTPLPAEARRTFQGYARPAGRAGTRNYLAVVSTVNCSAGAARQIAYHFTPQRLAAYPNVDGVIALTHGSGCPVGHTLLRRTLAGIVGHPNVAASLLVGLGCETDGVDAVLAESRPACRPVRRLVIQELGGLRPAVEAGIAALEELLPQANRASRIALPLSELAVALQCGGSDAWSGVTANPVVGLVSDELVRQGATAVLAETPEIYGAEYLLAAQAVSAPVAEKLIDWVRWWGEHARRFGLDLDQNRSTGNAAGGLTTIYEKSLGAVAKGGSTPLVEVYGYAEAVGARGLVFMNTPGFDPVSVTGQVAGGCSLVLFTTGRGSVFGFKPAPVIKIGSTTALYRRMPGDIDLDAGRALEGVALEEVAAELLDRVVAVASGEPSRSEAQGAGEAEFSPWNVEGVI